MIVQTVVLFRLQDHRAQSLELRHLLGEESLPGHVKFVGMAALPEEVGFHQHTVPVGEAPHIAYGMFNCSLTSVTSLRTVHKCVLTPSCT